MTVVIGIELNVVETITGQPLVKIGTGETLQLPLSAMDGDVAASVVVRLLDDVKDRATDQIREFARQAGRS